MERLAWLVAAAFTVVALVVVLLDALGVGPVPAELPEETAERVVVAFENRAAWYRTLGWALDLAPALAAVGIVVAAAHRPDAAFTVVVAGASIVVVGEMLDLSKLAAFDLAEFAAESGLASDFAAANVVSFLTDSISSWVWAAGVILLGAGIALSDGATGLDRWVAWIAAGSAIGAGVVGLTGPDGAFLPFAAVFGVTLAWWSWRQSNQAAQTS